MVPTGRRSRGCGGALPCAPDGTDRARVRRAGRPAGVAPRRQPEPWPSERRGRTAEPGQGSGGDRDRCGRCRRGHAPAGVLVVAVARPARPRRRPRDPVGRGDREARDPAAGPAAVEAFGYLGELELERGKRFDAAGVATPARRGAGWRPNPDGPRIAGYAGSSSFWPTIRRGPPRSRRGSRRTRPTTGSSAPTRWTGSPGAGGDERPRCAPGARGGGRTARRRGPSARGGRGAIAIAKEDAPRPGGLPGPLVTAREHLPADVGLGRQFMIGLRASRSSLRWWPRSSCRRRSRSSSALGRDATDSPGAQPNPGWMNRQPIVAVEQAPDDG